MALKVSSKNNSLMRISNPNSEWTLGNQLGAGSFGEVFVATNKSGGVKAVKICKIDEQDTFTATKIEVEILMVCQHENILRAFETYYWDKKMWIFMELCSGGAIEDILDFLDGIDEPTACVLLYQCLMGIDYLHKKGYMHRDIKAGNLMLTESGICKIADFGVAAVLEEPYGTASSFIGTPYWMAPEVILTETQAVKYDCKSDVYSIGITAIELLEGRPPNHDLAPPGVMIYRLRSDSPTLSNPTRWSSSYNEFVRASLMKQTAIRPSCLQCLEMELFKGNHVRSKEPLIELYNILQALKCGDVNEVELFEPDNKADDLSSFNYEPPSNTFQNYEVPADKIKAHKSVLKTVRYKVNGIQKEKSVAKVERVNESDGDFKHFQEKLVYQQRDSKLVESREMKKLEQLQKSQLDDCINRQTHEYNLLFDKYRVDCDVMQKNIIKEVEKRKLANRIEIEKHIKRHRVLIDKERKNVALAQKSKNKPKSNISLMDDKYLNGKLQACVDSTNILIHTYNKSLSAYYKEAVSDKNRIVEESLKNLIRTRLIQLIELAQLRRNHIHSKIECILQQRMKTNQKEINLTIKFMNSKREELIRQHIKARREIPRLNRVSLKKELDAYKAYIRQDKPKNERDLLNKKQKEIQEWLNVENEAAIESQRDEISKFDKENDSQLKDIQEYQDKKNLLAINTYEDLYFQQSKQDEKEFKTELYQLYRIKKLRVSEYENELNSAQSYQMDGLPKINLDTF